MTKKATCIVLLLMVISLFAGTFLSTAIQKNNETWELKGAAGNNQCIFVYSE